MKMLTMIMFVLRDPMLVTKEQMTCFRLVMAWSGADGGRHCDGMFFILSRSEKLKNYGFVQEYVSFLMLFLTKTLFSLSF
jgi:hypothetical protein